MSDKDRMAKLCSFVANLPEPRRPPLVLPPELGVTPEQIFKHIDPTAVPEIAPVLEWLMEHHPQVIAAVGDVDRSLIWAAMEETPAERLHGNERMASDIAKMQDAMRQRQTA